MKITDLKCAVIGNNPVVRINTDEGIYGLGEVEASKSYLKPHVLFYKDRILGQDPTDVERVMLNIRRLGSFKPWGSAVSAIEMALWDIAGKAAGVPVYKLLGGKVRDRVRVYNGAVRFPMAPARSPACSSARSPTASPTCCSTAPCAAPCWSKSQTMAPLLRSPGRRRSSGDLTLADGRRRGTPPDSRVCRESAVQVRPAWGKRSSRSYMR